MAFSIHSVSARFNRKSLHLTGEPLVIRRWRNPLTVVRGVFGNHMQPDPLETTHRMTSKSASFKWRYLSLSGFSPRPTASLHIFRYCSVCLGLPSIPNQSNRANNTFQTRRLELILLVASVGKFPEPEESSFLLGGAQQPQIFQTRRIESVLGHRAREVMEMCPCDYLFPNGVRIRGFYLWSSR